MPGQSKFDRAARRFGRERLRLDAELVRGRAQVVIQQLRDVLAPLAQRRHVDADHVQPVQQVLAELALAHALVEILVSRRDHAHVDAHRDLSADAIELALREHAQQPRLQLRRHVADLVEEQRAAVRLLEAPAALADRRR